MIQYPAPLPHHSWWDRIQSAHRSRTLSRGALRVKPTKCRQPSRSPVRENRRDFKDNLGAKDTRIQVRSVAVAPEGASNPGTPQCPGAPVLRVEEVGTKEQANKLGKTIPGQIESTRNGIMCNERSTTGWRTVSIVERPTFRASERCAVLRIPGAAPLPHLFLCPPSTPLSFLYRPPSPGLVAGCVSVSRNEISDRVQREGTSFN